MKIILDLDDKMVKDLQNYTRLQDITISELVSKLFNKYVQDPANIVGKLQTEKVTIQELEDFSELITAYVNEATLDIESLVGSDKEQENDKAMVEVFRRLNSKHLAQAEILTDLFTLYYDHNIDNPLFFKKGRSRYELDS